MADFVAIDFETANPKRVSACALGYTIVENGLIVENHALLIKPVGGHAAFQTKIHGITESDTADKPDFSEAYSELAHLFKSPLVGHSLFDKQVLDALSSHFGLGISFNYSDSATIAKKKLPDLKNHKLKTVAKYFDLPPFKHHDPSADSRACAEIFVRLQGEIAATQDANDSEFKTIARTILEDSRVDYKEAYQLLYWLEDLDTKSDELNSLYWLVKSALADDVLEEVEGNAIKVMLQLALEK